MRRLPLTSILALAGLALLTSPALASTTIDLRGTFNAQGQGGSPYKITITNEDCATGVVSGLATLGIGPEHGTLSGSRLMLHESYGGYTSDITATVSADNTTISGRFHDSNNLTAPWKATRTSGPPARAPAGCSSQTSQPKQLTDTVTQLQCATTTSPNATSLCTASVGAGPSAAAPTGVVQFGTDLGSFGSDASCTLAPVGEGESACSATYVPPGDLVFPDVTSFYPGDGSDLGSDGATTPLIDAPSDTGCTGSGRSSARTSASPLAHAALNSEAAQVPVDERGLGYCMYYDGASLLHHAINLVGQGTVATVGGVIAVAAPVGGAVAGSEAGPVGILVGGATGAAVSKEYILPATSSMMSAIGDAQSKALQDPPNPNFTTIAKPTIARVKPLRPTRGLSRATAGAITALVRAQQHAVGLAHALSLTIDRAGGAAQAANATWRGRQTRAAIADSVNLAALLDRLVVLQRAAAAQAGRSPALRAALVSERVGARRLNDTIARGFTSKGRRALGKAFGLDAAAVSRLELRLRTLDPTKLPRSAAALLADPTLTRMYQAAAAALRTYVTLPPVVAASKL